jgi:2-C-methyl-D-erythritol 2,4-cyclodiphosphate synthase
MRVGLGYDAHPLVEGRRLVLGGVEVPYSHGLGGHSDGDVLAHAVADAVLGAAGLGELGELFPASDPRWHGISSLVFLEEIARRLTAAAARLVNVDAVLVADRPRLGPYREQMRQRLAGALGVEVAQVAVKPKSNEGLGFEGTGAGMSARAVALVEIGARKGDGRG